MAKLSLKNLKPNKPKVNIFDFIWLVYGEPKSGKTSLFDAVVKEHFKGEDNRGLLLAFEKGYQALNGIFAVDIAEWEDFTDYVDDLVESAELEEGHEDKLSFKIIGLDTIDMMYEKASDYVVRKENIKLASKGERVNDITELDWGSGYKKVVQEMLRQIDRLVKAGYGLFMITHNTDREVTTKTNKKYTQTTVSLPKGAKQLVFNMADFIIYIEIARSKEKSGGITESRIIHLRSDGDIVAGSRFGKIVENVEYSATNLLKAFEDAVLAEYANDKNFDLEKEKERQAKEREEEVKRNLEAMANEIDVASILDYLDTNTSVKVLKGDARKKVQAWMKEHIGGTNYKKDGVEPEKLVELANFLKDTLEDKPE